MCLVSALPSTSLRAAAQPMRSCFCSLHKLCQKYQLTSIPGPPCNPQSSAQCHATMQSSAVPCISSTHFPIRKFFKRQRIDSRRDSPWGKKMRTDLLGPKVYLSRNSSGLWVEEEVNTWERTQRWGGRTVCLPLIQLTKGRGFHRIREQSGSEGTFKGHLVHLPSWRTQQAYCS